mmetsp:Transcript_59719/g.146477  ORF Transcript_59719/g.146477 Transcript_59719/m.146477 type:complete len:212 (-) Transcript_59719:1593-2228(-)
MFALLIPEISFPTASPSTGLGFSSCSSSSVCSAFPSLASRVSFSWAVLDDLFFLFFFFFFFPPLPELLRPDLDFDAGLPEGLVGFSISTSWPASTVSASIVFLSKSSVLGGEIASFFTSRVTAGGGGNDVLGPVTAGAGSGVSVSSCAFVSGSGIVPLLVSPTKDCKKSAISWTGGESSFFCSKSFFVTFSRGIITGSSESSSLLVTGECE